LLVTHVGTLPPWKTTRSAPVVYFIAPGVAFRYTDIGSRPRPCTRDALRKRIRA
jgi:hypothetical protein